MDGHKAEDMKGRLKEGVGDVIGDEDLQREGKVDQASAAGKEMLGKAADQVKSIVNPKS